MSTNFLASLAPKLVVAIAMGLVFFCLLLGAAVLGYEPEPAAGGPDGAPPASPVDPTARILAAIGRAAAPPVVPSIPVFPSPPAVASAPASESPSSPPAGSSVVPPWLVGPSSEAAARPVPGAPSGGSGGPASSAPVAALSATPGPPYPLESRTAGIVSLSPTPVVASAGASPTPAASPSPVPVSTVTVTAAPTSTAAPAHTTAPASTAVAALSSGTAPAPPASPTTAATAIAMASPTVATTPSPAPALQMTPIASTTVQPAAPTPTSSVQVAAAATSTPRAISPAGRSTPSAAAAAVPNWTASPWQPSNTRKIGVGIYAPGGNNMRAELAKARPGVVLLMDPDPEFVREVRKLLPTAFIVGRRYVKDQPLDDPVRRGAAFADYVAERAVPVRGLVDSWMSYNEPVKSGDFAAYRAYNQFQAAFAQRLQGHYGIAAVAGNDAPGAVDISEYPLYFREAIRASRYFGLHAYSSQKAVSFREADAAWYALRYRKIHEALEAAGIRGVSIVVTEVALVEGWQGRKITAEQMAADYAWLANEMHRDAYNIGYAAFGLFPDNGRWKDYQLLGTRVTDLMGFYQPPGARPATEPVLRPSVTPAGQSTVQPAMQPTVRR